MGGYFIGDRFLRRLDGVNLAVAHIIAGNLNEQLPAIGMSREFDALSGNLNAMLDRIGILMNPTRQVSTDIAHDLRTPLTRLRHQPEIAQATDPEGRTTQAIKLALTQTDDMLRVFHARLRIDTLEGGIGRYRLPPST